MQDEWKIRRAAREDAASIGRIHVLGWQVGYRHIIPADFLAGLDADKRRTYWDGVLAEGELDVIVAERAGTVLGWAAFGPDRGSADGDTLEVQAIYVHPDAWRTGAGTRLMTTATDHAARHAYARVSLWVLGENAAAMHFYTGLGFTAHATKSNTRGGREMLEVQMLRPVAPAGAAADA